MPQKTDNTEIGAPRRGRPRPQEVIQRDEDVLRLLRDRGAHTRVELAAALNLTIQEVYLSLYRHRMANPPLVRKERQEGSRAPVWVAI